MFLCFQRLNLAHRYNFRHLASCLYFQLFIFIHDTKLSNYCIVRNFCRRKLLENKIFVERTFAVCLLVLMPRNSRKFSSSFLLYINQVRQVASFKPGKSALRSVFLFMSNTHRPHLVSMVIGVTVLRHLYTPPSSASAQ